MADQYSFTHEELTQLVREAIMEDRSQRDTAQIEKVIDREDPESPAFNTNRLYVNRGKRLKEVVEAGQQRAHFVQKDYDTTTRPWAVRDNMRRLVNGAMLATNNAYVRPGDRRRAMELYEQFSSIWEEAFGVTVAERASEEV